MEKTNEFKQIVDRMVDTYVKKNSDYGNSFDLTCDEFGIVAALTRMSDKFLRIKQLALKGKGLVSDESIKDTLLDLANYSIMTLMWLNGKDNQ